MTPGVMRLTRAGMLEVLQSDYIRTAKAKGLRPMTVLFKHALRNAIIPVVSLAAVQFGFMLGGSIVIETIFAINGMGFLAWESIQRADLPMMQAIVLVQDRVIGRQIGGKGRDQEDGEQHHAADDDAVMAEHTPAQLRHGRRFQNLVAGKNGA